MVKATLLAMTVLLCYHPHLAAQPCDYYVHPVLGDNVNHDGKSPDEPFLTLTHAMVKARPGDTVHLFPGEYREDHGTHPQSCNLGEPEDFPIYLKEDVTIKAYDAVPGVVLLTTEENCKEDIFKIHVDTEGGGPHARWTDDSDANKSQIIGITFKTKASTDPDHGGG